MNLKDAIYTPSNINMARNRINMKPTTKYEQLKTNLTALRIGFISLFKQMRSIRELLTIYKPLCRKRLQHLIDLKTKTIKCQSKSEITKN